MKQRWSSSPCSAQDSGKLDRDASEMENAARSMVTNGLEKTLSRETRSTEVTRESSKRSLLRRFPLPFPKHPSGIRRSQSLDARRADRPATVVSAASGTGTARQQMEEDEFDAAIDQWKRATDQQGDSRFSFLDMPPPTLRELSLSSRSRRSARRTIPSVPVTPSTPMEPSSSSSRRIPSTRTDDTSSSRRIPLTPRTSRTGSSPAMLYFLPSDE
jgi:hypothetical protein